MGFDDLARHMASRDGKQKLGAQPGNADQIVAEAAAADRRMTRTRHLILGPLLLVGGLVILAFIALYVADALDSTPSPGRPPEPNDTFLVPIGGAVVAAGMVIVGFQQLIRGIKGGGPPRA